MKAFFTGLVLFFIVSLIGAAQADAQLKVGVVDVDVIVQQMPEFKDVETKLENLRKSYEDTLAALQQQFQQGLTEYQQQQAVMTDEAKQQEEARLGNIRDQFGAFQQTRLGPQGMYFQVQNQLLEPIRVKVRGAIEKIAKDEGLSAVMEKGVFVYADKKLDVTFKVLDHLQRGN